MLSEEALERLSERLISRIEGLNKYFVEKVAEAILKIGKVNPTKLNELKRLINSAADIDEIMNEIARVTNKNVNDIYQIFEDVAKQNYSSFKSLYNFKNIKYIPYDENKQLQKLVKSIADSTAETYLNIAKSTGYQLPDVNGKLVNTTLADTYQQIIDEAIVGVTQGRDTYDKFVKRSIRALTKSGLRDVEYNTGYSRRLDSSVRMNIQDGIRRVNRELAEKCGEEFGADGLEVSHHLYPAPDHSSSEKDGWYDIDGQQFSKKGTKIVKGITYEDFSKINEDLNRHLGELNCYHFFYPIILGISKPLYSKDELERDKKANSEGFYFEGNHYTMYEGTQLQRRLELKIREYKDRQIGSTAISDTEEIYNCNEKIRQLTQKYNDLCKESGLPTKVNRLKVDGYSKHQNINKDLTKEIIPNYEMYNQKKEYTEKEEYDLFNSINNQLNEELGIESKWSGNLNINDNKAPAKEWDCSITIGSYTLEQEIQHELLHAHSISYYGKEEYIKYQFEEEATVEFFNKQLLLKNNVNYYDNLYSNMVNKLEEICDIINTDKFQFSKELFKVRPSERENWILNKIKNIEEQSVIEELLKEAFFKW